MPTQKIIYKPALFQAPMVLALLSGRKTQTRRACKQAILKVGSITETASAIYPDGSGVGWIAWFSTLPTTAEETKRLYPGNEGFKPPHPVGSQIWVRETWRVGTWDEDNCKIAVDYRADNYARREWLDVPDEPLFDRLWIQSTDDAHKAGFNTDPDGQYYWQPGESPCRWRPSIFMPRWASRLTLEVTGVRVERVQNISEADARAEGIYRTRDGTFSYHKDHGNFGVGTAREAYAALWDSINGKKHPWESNPWVWCYSFLRIAI